MTLEKAQKILKVMGIITLVGAAVSLGLGVLAIAGGSYAAANMPEMQTNVEYQKAAGVIIGGGIGLIVVALLNLIEGIITLLSSKQNKYATATMIITIVSLVLTVMNGVSGMMRPSIDYTSLISFIASVAIDIVVIYAAKTIRDVYVADK